MPGPPTQVCGLKAYPSLLFTPLSLSEKEPHCKGSHSQACIKETREKSEKLKGLSLSGSWSHDDKITDIGTRQDTRQNTPLPHLISP